MINRNSLDSQLSLAKDKIRILLLENISETAVAAMRSAGYTNIRHLPKALDGNALKEAIRGCIILVDEPRETAHG